MSSVFQARLVGNSLRDNPVELADGSNVTLKNNGYGGALLHSHIQTYPEGSQQQQVTCYHHKDINNNWIVQVPKYRTDANFENADHARLIKDGDIIRLMHLQTGNHLRSHPIDAPVSADQWEVSAHRNESIEDQGDLWKIEVAMDSRHKHIDHVRSLTTRFRLRHLELGCLLAADNVVLPQWGFRQIEVVCNKDNQTQDESTWWNVEEHVNEKHPEKDDVLTSEPLEWPMISVGLRMCGWEDEQVKFYLLGNPAVWWPAFLSLWVFITSALVHTVRSRRQLACMPQGKIARISISL
ncbi:Protein O-mannosyltransferase 2 [Apophysomyces ossiformis]|uniref:Dolichyl-phosphate-mannose--protein mannosyltransferase n=1 Tax=Apophysomyces ossiformis TaxID=679940 RepID=A0A8H7ETS8_9FUNG|nr:Protein O-mannosyltransferase 2 [Apophysomyces ossiformis]